MVGEDDGCLDTPGPELRRVGNSSLVVLCKTRSQVFREARVKSFLDCIALQDVNVEGVHSPLGDWLGEP